MEHSIAPQPPLSDCFCEGCHTRAGPLLRADPVLLDSGGMEPAGQAEAQARAAALGVDSAALQARQSSHSEASSPEGQSRAEKLTSLSIEALRDTAAALFRSMPRACANCGAELPDIRRSACSRPVASVGASERPSHARQGRSQAD